MLSAEAVVALIFGVVVLSVFAFIGFPVLNRNKKIDAVLGNMWNWTPVKGARMLVVGPGQSANVITNPIDNPARCLKGNSATVVASTAAKPGF